MADFSRPEFWTKRYLSGETPWELGHPPAALLDWLARTPGGGRVLIPGVGSGHELPEFAHAGWAITAIDLSDAAIAIARTRLNGTADMATLHCADFFSAPLPFRTFDVIYERAFLCSLHPARWRRAVGRMAALLKPGGLLAGHYFFGETKEGPPFGMPEGAEHGLFDPAFELVENAASADSSPPFGSCERWQVRRRRD